MSYPVLKPLKESGRFPFEALNVVYMRDKADLSTEVIGPEPGIFTVTAVPGALRIELSIRTPSAYRIMTVGIVNGVVGSFMARPDRGSRGQKSD